MSNVEPPPLDKCVQSLKKLSHSASRSNSPKEQSELYLAAIGLLCRLKDDQATLEQAWKESDKEKTKVPCPPLDELPAMSAVIQDPNLFHSLLACLRAPTDVDGNSLSSISGDNAPPNVHSHGRIFPSAAQAQNPPTSNRKRSLSFAVGEGESNAPKAMKIQHSPLPVKKKVQPHGTEVNGEHRKRVQLNVRLVAATALYTAFQNLDHWPVQLIRAYAEDSFGSRSWVDDDRCAILTRNLELAHAESPGNENGKGAEEYSRKLLEDAEKVASFYTNFKAQVDDGGSSDAPGSSRARASSSGSFEFDRSPQTVTTSPEQRKGNRRIITAESEDLAGNNAASSDSDSGDEEECLIEVSTGTVSESVVPKSNDTNDDSSSSGEEDLEVVEMTDAFAEGDSVAEPPSENSPNGPISPSSSRSAYPVQQEFINLRRVRPRYFGTNLNHAHKAISDSLSDRLDVKSKQNSRLLLTLPTFVTVPEVRRLAARHLERWMQSPALSGPARTLFAATVNQMKHVEPPLPADEEAIDCILSMRLKANQLNAHIENVTSIAKRIPTASIARRLFLRLLREELDTIDSSSVAQPSISSMSDQLRMVTAVRAVLSPSLASDGLAEALLTLLANPNDEKVTNKSEMTRRERHRLVKKIRLLIRRIASVLGPSQFDGCRLVESLLSIDVDDASWSVKDEEDKGRLMFECITLLAQPPTPAESRLFLSKGQRKVSQLSADNSTATTSEDDIAALRERFVIARKLMLTWCCSDYAPMFQTERGSSTNMSASPSTRKGSQHEQMAFAGAGAPNFSSILDGKSHQKKNSRSCLNIMRCVLFMVEPESPLLYSFLHPDELPGTVADLDLYEERYRIQQCCEYGADLDDEMMWIILQSAAIPDTGMDPELALSLLEHLFESCKKGQKASLRLSDSKLVWELYKLVEYTPTIPNVERSPEPENGSKETNDNDKHGAYMNLISGVLNKNETSCNSGEPNSSMRNGVHVPRLAYPGMWWRATSIALVMCGVSPNGIGAEMWSEHPTLQALIKMVTSNRYRFPTVDCDDEARDIMKKTESDMREEESSITEMLFLPPAPKEEKKQADEDAPVTTKYRGSRVSARQRAKQEKLLREKREREKAQVLAEMRRRKKLLRSAQKSIMIWDPRRAARKPPRESVDLILSVEELFGLSEIFQQSTDPDFVLMTISDTSRQSIERAYDWLIPVISSLPEVIKRLPSSASCFLLLRAYGAEGDEMSQLRELSAPLLVHVSESLTGKFGEDDAIRAADLLLADVSDRNPDRRRCARRVLQEALSGLNKNVSDTTLAAAKCTWLLSILHVQHAPALIADCIQYISRGLAFERGRVLRAFVLALHRYIEFAKETGVGGSWDFASIVYTLVSSRHNVCSEAMDRFQDFLILAVTVVRDEFHAYLRKNPEKLVPESDLAVHITPYNSGKRHERSKEDESNGQIMIPLALLHAACVLLSNWKGQDDGDSNRTQEKTKEAILDLLDILLGEHDIAENTNGETLGISGATVVATGKKAIAVDQWVMLAKSRSNFVARRTALSAPTAILPRLLLCSGLPRTSLLGMIDRVGKLGDKGTDQSKVFSQLLVPSATADWGVGYLGTKREIARKLLGRLSAYLALSPDGKEPDISTNFLQWLSLECQEKLRKPRQKKSPKAGQTSLGCFKNVSSVQCVLSDLSEDAPHTMEEPKVPLKEDSESIMAMVLQPESKSATQELQIAMSDESAAHSFIDKCFNSNDHVSLENWLENAFYSLVSPPANGKVRNLSDLQTDFIRIAVLMLEAQSKVVEKRSSLTRTVVQWVPLLTQSGGSLRLWEILFGSHLDSPQDVWNLLLSRSAAVWRQNHVSACQRWILSDAPDNSILCLPRMVKFLVLTSGQHSVHIMAFSRGLEKIEPFASETEREVTAAASLALECMKETGRSEPGETDVDSRNEFPDWLLLLLLVARQSKKHMKGVTDAILAHVPQEKGRTRQLACSTVLRLYCYYPRAMNLGNAMLRSLLVEATEALSSEWLDWRSPFDEQLDDMLSSLRINPHQRLVQALGELSKDHPLLVLRKLAEFVEILEQDGAASNSRSQSGLGSERRGRVQGDYLLNAAQAYINGRYVKVTIRHWGYSFSEPLWLSVLDIISLVPHQVLFSCGLAMGLPDLLSVFVRLVFLHSQFENRENESRLRGRLSELLSAFQTSNKAEWDQWCDSSMPGVKSFGTTKELLSRCRLIAPTRGANDVTRRSQ